MTDRTREPAAAVVVYHHRTQGADAQGIHVSEMCRAFEALGLRVVKVSPYAEEAVGRESRTGVVAGLVARMPRFAYELMEIGYNLVSIPRLWLATVRNRPRLIYERHSLFNVAGIVVSALTGRPLVLECNSPLARERREHGGLVFGRLGLFLENLCVRRATACFAVSGELKRLLEEQAGAFGRVNVLPNGVNLNEYPAPGRAKHSGQEVVLGFVGWFRAWHGLVEMLQALDRTGLLKRQARLLLIGDGPARKAIEAEAASLGLSERVRITGAVGRDQVFALLREVDIALQPAATSYASPMKLLEYMASGKAIVALDQLNIRELVTDGQEALLFPPGDWAALGERIAILVNNPDLRATLGQAARTRIEREDRTWTGNARRVLERLGVTRGRRT